MTDNTLILLLALLLWDKSSPKPRPQPATVTIDHTSIPLWGQVVLLCCVILVWIIVLF